MISWPTIWRREEIPQHHYLHQEMTNSGHSYAGSQNGSFGESRPAGLPFRWNAEYFGRLSTTRATLIAIFCTLSTIFDVPVYWPILVMYFFVLFFLTMRRQIQLVLTQASTHCGIISDVFPLGIWSSTNTFPSTSAGRHATCDRRYLTLPLFWLRVVVRIEAVQ